MTKLWHLHNHLKCDVLIIQPSSLTDVDTVKENPFGRAALIVVAVAAAWMPPFSLKDFVISSFFISPGFVSGHKILAIPKESFIMYSLRAQRAVTTMPWEPGPLASQLAGRRPESLMTVFSCVAIKCLSQLLRKGLSKFSIYLQKIKFIIVYTHTVYVRLCVYQMVIIIIL